MLRKVMERSGIVPWMTVQLNDPRSAVAVTHDLSSLIRTCVMMAAPANLKILREALLEPAGRGIRAERRGKRLPSVTLDVDSPPSSGIRGHHTFLPSNPGIKGPRRPPKPSWKLFDEYDGVKDAPADLAAAPSRLRHIRFGGTGCRGRSNPTGPVEPQVRLHRSDRRRRS